MPNPSRLTISIPTASADNLYHGRYPAGNAPFGNIAGAATDALTAAANLRTGVGLQGAASDAITAAGHLNPGPGQVTGLQIMFQGMNAAGQGTSASAPVPTNPNTQGIGWTQAVAGTYPITQNNIYRSTNGGAFTLLATISAATSYTDTAATNCVGSASTPHNSVGQAWAANGYLYKVSAVDGQGVEGPLSTTQIFVYYKGAQQKWGMGGDVNNGVTSTYNDTTGASPYGTEDLLNTTTSFGDWLPYAGNNATQWNIWCGTGSPAQVFAYLNISIKPSVANQTFNAWVEYRNDSNIDPQGSQPGITGIGNVSALYGPQAQAGVWATYKLPLSLLMVTATVDYPPGGVVGGMFYKLGLADQTGLSANHYWVDNVYLSPT